MNCRNFEAIIDDTARGALMDAAQREAALGHAAECTRCGARLSDGRSLTAGLRSLASLTAEASAPARVEAALLAAFRERHAAAGANTSAVNADAAAASAPENAPAAATTQPVAATRTGPAAVNTDSQAPARALPFVSRARGSQWWLPRWAQGAAVAAASALVVFGLYAFMREQTPRPAAVAGNDAPSARAVAESHGAAAQPPNVSTAVEPHSPAVASAVEELADNDADEKKVKAVPRAAGRTDHRAAQRPAGGRRPNAIDAGLNGGGAEAAEIATEFIPLMNGGRLPPGDSGHLMRVEVPRTALASFGLPVNADHAGGRVKADVLIGEDGMARAIRFVR